MEETYRLIEGSPTLHDLDAETALCDSRSGTSSGPGWTW